MNCSFGDEKQSLTHSTEFIYTCENKQICPPIPSFSILKLFEGIHCKEQVRSRMTNVYIDCNTWLV